MSKLEWARHSDVGYGHKYVAMGVKDAVRDIQYTIRHEYDDKDGWMADCNIWGEKKPANTLKEAKAICETDHTLHTAFVVVGRQLLTDAEMCLRHRMIAGYDNLTALCFEEIRAILEKKP